MKSINVISKPLKVLVLVIMVMMCTSHTVKAQNTYNKQIAVKEIVSAKDPYAGQSLRGAVTVYEEDFNATDRYLPIKVKYMDRNNNPSDIERIKIFQDGYNYTTYAGLERSDFNLGIKSINDYTVNIYGSDGRLGKCIGTTHIVVGGYYPSDKEEDRYLAREDLVKSLMVFAKSPRNNAFPLKEVTMNVFPNMIRSDFSMRQPDFSWVKRTGLLNTNYGARVFGSANVKTTFGTYNVTFYSNDGNSGNYETVVITRDDGLRCKVDRLRETELRFRTDDGFYDSIIIKFIDISDPMAGKFSIIDDVMYDSLMTLKDDTVNNKSIRFWKNISEVEISESGIK